MTVFLLWQSPGEYENEDVMPSLLLGVFSSPEVAANFVNLHLTNFTKARQYYVTEAPDAQDNWGEWRATEYIIEETPVQGV